MLLLLPVVEVRSPLLKSAIKYRGQPHKIAKKPWNLVSWVTPRRPRSRWINLPNHTLTKYASGGSAWNRTSFSTCTFPDHTFRTKEYHFSSDTFSRWTQLLVTILLSLLHYQPLQGARIFSKSNQPWQKNNIFLKPIDSPPPVFMHVEFRRITKDFIRYFNLESIFA